MLKKKKAFQFFLIILKRKRFSFSKNYHMMFHSSIHIEKASSAVKVAKNLQE